MFTAFCCARCGRSVRVLAWYRGKMVRCPGCAIRLAVPALSPVEEPASSLSDPFGRPKVHGAAANFDASASPAALSSPQSRWGLPWMFLMPAILALGVPWWIGYGMLWAGLGVGLGALCLLVGQWGRWALTARVGASLGLALAGHGLAFNGWLRNPERALPFTAAEAPPRQTPTSFFPRGGSAALAPIFPMMAGASSAVPSMPGGMMAGPPERELQPIGHFGACLAATFSPNKDGKGSAYTTTADGLLKRFSLFDLQLQATYRLDQPAYRAVLDGRRGRLWVAASKPDALRVSRHGDPPKGRGDLHVYDVPPLSGKLPTQTALHPRRVLTLDGNVTELLAAPDQRRLFYLAQTEQGVHLGRIDTDKEELDAKLSLPPESHALCLTPDGKTLYAAGAGMISAIDSADMRVHHREELERDIWSVTADNEGHVYVGRQGQWTDVTLLDLSGPRPSAQHWSATLHGRVYLKLASDQARLYASSSSVISSLIESLLVRGHNRIPPAQIGVTQTPSVGVNEPNERKWVGGEFFLAPDGRYLVSCRGHVYQLAPSMAIPQNAHPPGTPPLISRMRGGGPTRPPG